MQIIIIIKKNLKGTEKGKAGFFPHFPRKKLSSILVSSKGITFVLIQEVINL